MSQQRTSRWALENSFNAQIKTDREKEENKILDEAMVEIAELRSYERIDNVIACYAGEY